MIDPESQQRIGIAKDEPTGWVKYLRIIIPKGFWKFGLRTINIYEDEYRDPLFSIHMPASIQSPTIVNDRNGALIGGCNVKIAAIKTSSYVFDSQHRQVAELKMDWKGWNFKFIGSDGQEIVTVTKKWAGVGKELFTSADDCVISIKDVKKDQPAMNILLLAAGLIAYILYM